MQAAPTAAIVVRLDVLSSQMLIWSIFASFDLILWAISLVFARCKTSSLKDFWCFAFKPGMCSIDHGHTA